MGDSRPTVQRTLVKSPPELWADLSDPESLGKRLGEFGEIRITRLIPEKTVVWEGERASGTVEIESSGWGTRVRLSARATAPASEEAAASEEDLERELAVEAALRAEIEREAAIEAALLAELEAEIEREVEMKAQLRAEAEAEAAAEAARVREIAEADRALEAKRKTELATTGAQARTGEPGRGFFSRFRKRRRSDPPSAAATAPAAKPAVAGQRAGSSPTSRVADPSVDGSTDSPAKQTPAKQPTPSRPAAPGHRPPVRLAALAFAPAKPVAAKPANSEEPASSLADSEKPASTLADFDKPGAETITASRHPGSEKKLKPALDDEQTLAVLAGVLDDLGAAHHRPFSRDQP